MKALHSSRGTGRVSFALALAVHLALSAHVARAVDYSVPSGPYKLAAGDLNGDGVDDLAVASSTADTVTVLINNGSGGFISSSSLSVTSPFAVATGQFNKDADSN